MQNPILDQQLLGYRDQVDEVVKDLHQLTIEIQHEELAQTVSELRNRIKEPFMFVIVGEVKAGKSSFINALLATGKEVTAVAPDPCTDTIQQIQYGPEEKEVVINPFLKKILLPVEILKEISIVDTPGTNTIIEHHQEITEKFVPGSDLIVFVFEAKNPYRQSAWEFFDFIHADWRKKTIFVLQQADLMPEEDLQINIRGVIQQAEKKGLEAPRVFAVSAKREWEGDHVGSGYGPLKAYIQENITGGKAPLLKLENNLVIAGSISDRLAQGLQTRRQQFMADKAFRQEVIQTLHEQEGRSSKQVDMLVENLLGEYDRITQRAVGEISGGLNFFSLAKRSFLSIFSKESSIKEWLNRVADTMEADLNKGFNRKLNEGVVGIAESIQQMAKLIDLKIQHSRTILKDNHEIFGAIADKRSKVLQELQAEFTHYMNEGENFVGKEVFEKEHAISPKIATGSGLAVIGVVLAAVTQYIVLDITGGILAAIGVLFAGITVSMKRRSILKDIKGEVQAGRLRLEGEIDHKLKAYIQQIVQQINEKFVDFDAMLSFEEERLAVLDQKFSAIEARLGKINEAVGRILS